MQYAGPLQIVKSETLSAEESEVEERFAMAVQADLDGIISEYRSLFGNVVDTDRAREFSKDYCASKESRTRFSRASYKPAKALADEIFRRSIRIDDAEERLRVLFTSGGTGVGKSSALAMLEEEADPEQKYDLLVDGTLSDHEAARSKIHEALSVGHEVTIVHIHREFAETMRFVIQRAVDMGRAVTLDNIAATHFRATETLFKLAEEFGGHVHIRIIENSADHPGREISLEELGGKQAKSVDHLRKMAQSVLVDEFTGLEADHPVIHEALLQKGSRR